MINSFLTGRSDEQHTNPSVERAQQLSQQQRAEHGRLESANTDDNTERGSRRGQSEGLTTSTSQQTQHVSVVASAVNRARLMIQQSSSRGVYSRLGKKEQLRATSSKPVPKKPRFDDKNKIFEFVLLQVENVRMLLF